MKFDMNFVAARVVEMWAMPLLTRLSDAQDGGCHQMLIFQNKQCLASQQRLGVGLKLVSPLLPSLSLFCLVILSAVTR